MLEVFKKKANQPPKPNKVFWWLQFICNLRCNHCSIGKNTNLGKFQPTLSLSEKKQIINKLHQWLGNDFKLTILAGEPFLHPDILDLFKHADKHNIKTSVTSNSTLISTPKQAQRIVKSGLTHLNLSLDSFSEKIHDQSRGRRGIRNQVFKTVKNITKEKMNSPNNTPHLIINSIIMKDNLNELPELVKWVKEQDLFGITFQPLANPEMFEASSNYGDDWYKHSPLWPKPSNAISVINRLEQMKEKGFPIKHTASDFQRFKTYFKNPNKFAQGPANKHELKQLLITKNGSVKMCPSLNKSFGNILTDDLDKMWYSKTAHSARDHILSCKSQCKILANTRDSLNL